MNVIVNRTRLEKFGGQLRVYPIQLVKKMRKKK